MRGDNDATKAARPFLVLAHGLYAVGHAVNCNESCAHVHDGHGCEHERHACGCSHSESYEFEWFPSGDVAERWSERALASLLQFISRLDCRALSVEEIEARLEWWWRGENRALRKAMERAHRTRCERGRGVLINRVTGEAIRARCKSWRECDYCACVYERTVRKLLGQVRGLRAFVVFTMPPELGDWRDREHLRAQATAKRRVEERLARKCGHRFAMAWTREHNTKGEGPGRLHLNVLWDENWVDQAWLSETAKACGFGEVVHISRIGARGSVSAPEGRGGTDAVRYATKCLRYATKDLATQADWPKGTRRWGASRRARVQMQRPARNPDWFFTLEEPPEGWLPADFGRYRRLRPDEMRARGIGCLCADFVACCCGAWELAGRPRISLSREERLQAARASPEPSAA